MLARAQLADAFHVAREIGTARWRVAIKELRESAIGAFVTPANITFIDAIDLTVAIYRTTWSKILRFCCANVGTCVCISLRKNVRRLHNCYTGT